VADLKKKSFEDSWVNLQLNGYLKLTAPCVCCYTLPCEALMSAKQTINDKLQGSVAAYVRCGKDVNN